MSAFVDLLRSEITRLEGQLKHARALLASYEGAASVAPQIRRPSTNGATHRPFQPKGADSKEQKVRAAVRDILGQRGSLHRTEILEHVKGLGLMGYEKDPLKALGVYLNHFKNDVSSEGAGKWRLKEAE